MGLIRTEKLEEILKATILTSKVAREDVKPLSLFLVAPPERGKTSVAVAVAADHSLVVTDCSGIGILEMLTRNPNATHIVLTDLTSVSGHKEHVRALTVAILNGLAEEGTYGIALPSMSHLDMHGRQVGIIACCTPDMLQDNRTWWMRSGFSSRLLIVQYDHAPSLTLAILRDISAHDGKRKDIKKSFALPAVRCFVSIDDKCAGDILNISQFIAKENGEIGYRKEKQLRSLACGHALLRGWKGARVTRADVDWLESITHFVTSRDGVALLK